MSEAIDNKLEENATKRKAEENKSRFKIRRKNWVDFNNSDARKEKNDSDRSSTEERIKKRKCCLLLGYSGVNYFGMQRNPDMKTIEEDLLVAMLKNKWINDEAFKQAQVVQFQRAARTDKGVSAARQCVSMKLRKYIFAL